MEYFLRFSIIFVTFFVTCIKFEVNAKNFNQNVLRTHVESNEPNENSWALQKTQKHPMRFQSNVDSSSFEDYNQGGEDFDENVQYSGENTQNYDSSDDGDDDEDGESQLMVDKRGYKKPTLIDLCPMHLRQYKLKREWKSFSLRTNHTEHICNHTKASHGYDRHFNKVCASLGSTTGLSFGTHCFQRYTSKDIEVVDMFGTIDKYTEERFKDGCSCGWAEDELGRIDEYHIGNKVLNLCNRFG